MGFQEPTFPNSHSFSRAEDSLRAIVVTCLDAIWSVSSEQERDTRQQGLLRNCLWPMREQTRPHIHSGKRKCGFEVGNVESASLNPQIFL